MIYFLTYKIEYNKHYEHGLFNEAVVDLIASESAAFRKVAMNQMRGGLSSRTGELRFISLIVNRNLISVKKMLDFPTGMT